MTKRDLQAADYAQEWNGCLSGDIVVICRTLSDCMAGEDLPARLSSLVAVQRHQKQALSAAAAEIERLRIEVNVLRDRVDQMRVVAG